MSFWSKVVEEMNYNPEINRKKLSYLTGIPLQTINRAIERDSDVYLKDALKVAKAFNKPVDYFLDEPVTLTSETVSESQKKEIEMRNYELHLISKYRQLLQDCEAIDEPHQNMINQLAKSLAENSPAYTTK